ncbi:MAG: glycosyltransferase family protein [Alphaproteobacteria bacterium]|nr:glycosyltransferase family protein [Alphaproteobacteria bacterium]
MSRSVVIVQARYTSIRLPGKVLRPLAGKTVLRHVLERCLAIEAADAVCCAVPETADSDAVAEEAKRIGVAVFRGSEADVLARYHGAARHMQADVVLRVTSDCPLLDPEICSRVLKLREAQDADYACNNMPPSWPHGLDCEAMPFSWLDRAHREAQDPFQREHVTPFLRTHDATRKANLPCPVDGAAKHRWTLDTPRDLAFLEAVFERMEMEGGMNWRGPLALVEADSKLAAINAAETTPARSSSGTGQ